MSVSFNCQCDERKKSDVKTRNWVVVDRLCNHSAFNGYRYTPSDYSHIKCLTCGKCGRTKAKYVSELPDATQEETLRAV